MSSESLRISTALLLTRGEGQALEVFLARRSPKLRFFGGYWALPGGVVDDVDVEGERDGDATHLRCGLRELFEELGVLPRPMAQVIDVQERERLRAELLAGRTPPTWRARVDATPEARAALRPIGRLTTPPFAALRYRTRFLHLALPAGEVPSIVPGELLEGRFFRPLELVREWRAGELPVVPPALVFAELFAGSLEKWLVDIETRSATSENGRQHPIRATPGVCALPLRTPTLPPATTTSTYVVGEERLYVVDPATYEAAERARLFDFLDDRLREGRRLEGVLVTHHHRDHVGSVAAVAERYDLAVLAHPLTLERLPERVARTRVIDEGSVLDLGRAPDGSPAWRLAAHHTPGHDRGHLVFRESRYRALIAGDLASTVSTIVIDPPEGHLATYLASLERVRALGIGTLYPAHGPAARDGDALLRRYVVHRRMREAALVRGLEGGLATSSELLAHVYSDVEPSLHGLAERSLLAGLEKLEEEGRARRQGERWSAARS